MQKDLYAASCHPSRRAKRSLSPRPDMSSTTQPNHPPPVLPLGPYAPSTSGDVDDAVPRPSSAPTKRGRKPGPLSRSARETQRRLNHSIIEKARRTKINGALATLQALVPPTYGLPESPTPEEDDDDEDEYQDGSKKAKPKAKSKKDQQEKEFKLEILVRTVSFLQDLLKRVSDLEATATPVCQNCASNGDPVKRKRKQQEAEDDTDGVDDTSFGTRSPKQSRVTAESSAGRLNATGSADLSSVNLFKKVSQSMSSPRLPSISSWLPSSIDPNLLPPPKSTHSSPSLYSYLPSPPSSTPFEPIRSFQVPPALHLGPGATMPSATMYQATGNENAASLPSQIGVPPSSAQHPRWVWNTDSASGPPLPYKPTSRPPETRTQVANLKRRDPSWG